MTWRDRALMKSTCRSRFAAGADRLFRAAPAPISRSRVIGKWRTRTPVACQTALATAPAVPVTPISPTPLMPSALTCGSCSSTRMASSEGTSAFTGTWYSPRFGVHRPAGARVHHRVLVQRERHAPDHAAVILAAHQPRIDDPAGREGADEPGHADLPELGIDLHLGEHGAVRVHGVGSTAPPGRPRSCRAPRFRARPARARISA